MVGVSAARGSAGRGRGEVGVGLGEYECGGDECGPVGGVAGGAHALAGGEVDEHGVADGQDPPVVADGQLVLERAPRVPQGERPLSVVAGQVEDRGGPVGGPVLDVPAVGGREDAARGGGVGVAVVGGGLGQCRLLAPDGHAGVGALIADASFAQQKSGTGVAAPAYWVGAATPAPSGSRHGASGRILIADAFAGQCASKLYPHARAGRRSPWVSYTRGTTIAARYQPSP